MKDKAGSQAEKIKFPHTTNFVVVRLQISDGRADLTKPNMLATYLGHP
jgi:hypothetical protein